MTSIAGDVTRQDARQTGRELLRDASNQRHHAEQLSSLRLRLNELEQRLREQHEAERLLAEFCKRQGQHYEADALAGLQQELEAQIEQLNSSVSDAGEQRMMMRQSWSSCVNASPA